MVRLILLTVLLVPSLSLKNEGESAVQEMKNLRPSSMNKQSSSSTRLGSSARRRLNTPTSSPTLKAGIPIPFSDFFVPTAAPSPPTPYPVANPIPFGGITFVDEPTSSPITTLEQEPTVTEAPSPSTNSTPFPVAIPIPFSDFFVPTAAPSPPTPYPVANPIPFGGITFVDEPTSSPMATLDQDPMTPSPVASLEPQGEPDLSSRAEENNSPTEAPLFLPVFCFSGQTTVEEKTRGSISMRDLKVGDKVMTGKGTFESVFSFGHYDANGAGEFLQFFPSKLELSKDHMVFVQDKGAIPAEMVKVGDIFESGGRIEAIQKVIRTGIFAPFTPSGTIVVNGVLSSTYISFQGSDKLILGSIVTPLSFQWLAHSFQTAQRLWCYWLGGRDQVLENGLSPWINMPFKATNWFVKQHPFFMALLLMPLLVLLVGFNLIETMLIHPALLLAGMTALAFALRHQSSLKKQ